MDGIAFGQPRRRVGGGGSQRGNMWESGTEKRGEKDS